MTKQNNLFLATLDALHKSGAFECIILIGSWCHHFYRVYFNNAPEKQVQGVRSQHLTYKNECQMLRPDPFILLGNLFIITLKDLTI